MQSQLDSLKQLLPPVAGDLLPYVLLAVAALVVLWIWRRLFRRQNHVGAPLPANLKVDIASLEDSGPPDGLPVLEFYNLPVRLAAIVLAPMGRVGDVPPDDELAPLLDAIVPGLDKVFALHRPLVRRWPNQVSARGFAHIFFNNVLLPGAGGKNTPWSSVAGAVKGRKQPVMAGLVLRAARSNGFGQTIVDSEEKWLGCLRVKWS